MAKKYHVLPMDPKHEVNDRTKWFFALNQFEKQETIRQVEYKRRMWPELVDGCYSKKKDYFYPHILLESDWLKNVSPKIQDQLIDYLDKNNIALHTEAANLRSSQVCCFNFLFPLKLNKKAATIILSPLLPGVRKISEIEFEDTGKKGSTEWLGEPVGGQRGQNRTSADASIEWKDDKGRQRLTYIEWKYTERKFGDCGGYKSKGNKRKDICRTLDIFNEPWKRCYLSSGCSDRSRRRYWKHISHKAEGETPPVMLERFQVLKECPFRGPLYQLMRLELLSEYARLHYPEYDMVEVAVICFEENRSLCKAPSELRSIGNNIMEIWKSVLRDSDSFREVSVEKLLQGFDQTTIPELVAWRNYLNERYGI